MKERNISNPLLLVQVVWFTDKRIKCQSTKKIHLQHCGESSYGKQNKWRRNSERFCNRHQKNYFVGGISIQLSASICKIRELPIELNNLVPM